MLLKAQTWLPYRKNDLTWAPNRSPDKTGSVRLNDTPAGVLVCVSPVEIHGRVQYLPGVYLNGRWLETERAYGTMAMAKKHALEQYKVQVAYEPPRAVKTNPARAGARSIPQSARLSRAEALPIVRQALRAIEHRDGLDGVTYAKVRTKVQDYTDDTVGDSVIREVITTRMNEAGRTTRSNPSGLKAQQAKLIHSLRATLRAVRQLVDRGMQIMSHDAGAMRVLLRGGNPQAYEAQGHAYLRGKAGTLSLKFAPSPDGWALCTSVWISAPGGGAWRAVTISPAGVVHGV